MTRPDRDEWHLDGADWLARMGDCTRRRVGALIVGPDKRIWGLGYNGGRPGGPSCLDGACPRGLHGENGEGAWFQTCDSCVDPWKYRSGTRFIDPDRGDGYSLCSDCRTSAAKCLCGGIWPCRDAVEPGSSYDTGPGACISTHAESNAKADAQMKGYSTLPDAVMFVSCEPCEGCVRDLRNTTQLAAIRWRSGVIGLP